MPPTLVANLGANIPTEPVRNGKKEVVITLAKAVAQTNNRGSINAAQRAGRKRKGPAPATVVEAEEVVQKAGRKRKAPAPATATAVEADERPIKRVRRAPARYAE